MTHDETKSIIAIIRSSYPRFYDRQSAGDIETMIVSWEDMFIDSRANTVASAVKSFIKTHTAYPPGIADIFAEIDNLQDISDDGGGDLDLWQKLYDACRRGIYLTKAEYDELPAEVKTLYTLTDIRLIGQGEESEMKFTRNDFFKRLPTAKKKVKDKKRYREQLQSIEAGNTGKDNISTLINSFAMPTQIPASVADQTERRNSIINTIDTARRQIPASTQATQATQEGETSDGNN